VAGLTGWGRPAIGRRPSIAVSIWGIVPHALMVAVMLWAMVGQQSVFKSFGGAVALIVAAIAYAPGARERVVNRDHIVDLWAMALVLIGAVQAGAVQSGAIQGGAAATGERAIHGGMRMSTAPAGFIVPICLGWAALRLLLLVRWRGVGFRGRVIGAAATAIGLVVMALAG
jgi:hypothetical protein